MNQGNFVREIFVFFLFLNTRHIEMRMNIIRKQAVPQEDGQPERENKT